MRRLILTLVLLAAPATPLFPEFRQKPPGEFPSLKPVLDAAGKPVADRAGWAAARAALLGQWRQILGPFPDRVPLNPQVLSTEELTDHTRLLVRYQTDPTWTNEAYVLLPKGPDGKPLPGKRSGMVVLHQTSNPHMRDPVGLDGREPVHIALHLVRRGYVCVAPKNFLWAFEGKSIQQATQTVLAQEPWKTGMAKMVWDSIRATDLLAERPEVDPDRLGCAGHSLGGKEALYLAAFDERIKAAISCEGGVGLSFSNWNDPWYLGKQIRDPGFGRDNHEVIALIAPRALLVIGGESADGAKSWPYIEANLPLWRLFDAEDKLGLMRHAHGHNFPPPGPERERVYEWLDHWLGNRRP